MCAIRQEELAPERRQELKNFHLAQMTGKKIFNDPVYGFVTVPYGLLFDLIEQPVFQRLRRIKQVSLTHYVYPGALHTRFHHALGALHLMQQAIEVLRSKGTEVTDQEEEAACIAILLHDIGHGPFSHTLEHSLINISHEELSLLLMRQLDGVFGGRLAMAIDIFNDGYPKKFLHQLVSGQLDMDRLDYLNRDSFFTGVSEGVIGYDRIIKMLAVVNDELVVEEKGIYSIEKFLIARRLMYWQVYLHKTVLAAEQMLVRAVGRAKVMATSGAQMAVSPSLHFFLKRDSSKENYLDSPSEVLHHFSQLDDYDVVAALKSFQHCEDDILRYLSTSLVNRRLFRIELRNTPFESDYIAGIRRKVALHPELPKGSEDYLIFGGEQTNTAYTTAKGEIKILFKNGTVLPMSQSADYEYQTKVITKFFLCYPKIIQ
jgi:hypothetical protein